MSSAPCLRQRQRGVRGAVLAVLAVGMLAAGCVSFVAGDDGDPTSPVPIAEAGSDATPGEGGRPLAGFGAARVIARTAPGLRGVAVDTDRVYFANEETGRIHWAAKDAVDASAAELAVSPSPTDVVLDSTRVYWIDPHPTIPLEQNPLYRSVKKDGSNPRDSARTYFESTRLIAAAGSLYTLSLSTSSYWFLIRDGSTDLINLGYSPASAFTSNGTSTFYAAVGAIRSVVPDDAGAPFAIADVADMTSDAATVYWVTTTGLLQRRDVGANATDTPTDLAAGLSGAARITVDEEYVYVTAWGLGPKTGRLVAVPKAGGPSVDLATGLREPWGVAVDRTGVYVTDHADGALLVVPRN